MKGAAGRRRRGNPVQASESAAMADSAELNEKLRKQGADLAAGSAAMREQIAAVRAMVEKVPVKVRVSLKATPASRWEHVT